MMQAIWSVRCIITTKTFIMMNWRAINTALDKLVSILL